MGRKEIYSALHVMYFFSLNSVIWFSDFSLLSFVTMSAWPMTTLDGILSIHRPSKILNCLSKTMHTAASLRKKERLSPSPYMHTASIWGRRKALLGQGFF